MTGSAGQQTFKRNAHINYFVRCLKALPTSAQSNDSNRITIAYFCISALDLLGALLDKTVEEQRQGWVEWIWSLQAPEGGFRGSTYMTTRNDATSPGHLPSTYTALLTLALLRAPFDRLNIPKLVTFLRSCQADDGSFSPIPGHDTTAETSFQSDVRMMYIACVISSIIGDFSGVNATTAKGFLDRSQTWEGGYASRPGVIEAQGGTTFCAVAALSLLDETSIIDGTTVRWLLQRQIGGFQGRPGKLEDVCYSFWCGGALLILGKADLMDRAADYGFLLSAQSPLGGFGKEPDDCPDPLHSYLALAALAISNGAGDSGLGLALLDPRWNVSVETTAWLKAEIKRIQ